LEHLEPSLPLEPTLVFCLGSASLDVSHWVGRYFSKPGIHFLAPRHARKPAVAFWWSKLPMFQKLFLSVLAHLRVSIFRL